MRNIVEAQEARVKIFVTLSRRLYPKTV